MYKSEDELMEAFNGMGRDNPDKGLALRGAIYEDLGFIFEYLMENDIHPEHLAALSGNVSSERLRMFAEYRGYEQILGKHDWLNYIWPDDKYICERIGHLSWSNADPESGGYWMACYLCDFEDNGYMNG